MRPLLKNADYFSAQVSQTRRFYQQDGATPSGSQLVVVGGGCEWCTADFLIKRQDFPYTALEFVWSGHGRLKLGSRWHDLAPGAVYLFDHSVPHIIRNVGAEPLVKYFFNFTGDRILQLCAEWRLRPGMIFRTVEPVRLVELMNEAIDCALKGNPHGVREAAATLEHALALCAGSRRPWQTAPEGAHATYQRCRNFILRHYPALSSVQDAARVCSVTPAYLTRLFQRFERNTPYAYLQRLKMNEAMLRLRQPGAQVKGVASALEFKSAAHFSRAFKSFHGLLPREAQKLTS